MLSIHPQDFLSLSYPADLTVSPDGAYCAWMEYAADLAGNTYLPSLKLASCQRCDSQTDSRPLSFSCAETPSSLTWEDSDHLLYLSVRRGRTSVHRIDIQTGSDETIAQINASIRSVYPLTNGHLLVLINENFRPSVSDEASILDEIPFWANGKGITNGLRSRLCVWDGAQLTPISPEDSEIGIVSVHKDEVLYSLRHPIDKKMKFAALYCCSLSSGFTVQLVQADTYDIFGAWRIKDHILVCATDMHIWGNVQNPDFYRIDLPASFCAEHSASPDYPYTVPAFDPSLFPMVPLLSPDLGVTNDVTTDARYGSSSQWSVCGGRLYFIATTRMGSQLCSLDTDGVLQTITPDDGRTIAGVSSSGPSIAVIQETDSRCGEVFLLNASPDSSQNSSRTLQRLSNCNDEYFTVHRPVRPRRISFFSGREEMDGYVLLPPDFSPQKQYPGVLQIHGGPKLAYGSIYHMEMQAMAARGWIVFYCNPSGSDGRGSRFMDLRGVYGQKDYDDLMAFTDTVLKQYPQIDASRLAVCGGSYGGFMVNWIIGHTNRFCCAISQRGISNWISMFCTGDTGYRFVADQLDGTPWSESQRFLAQSPIRYADRVSTPTLFIHSDQDFRCPLGEGLQMFTALRFFRVESRLCLLHGENHELSRSGRPRQRLKRLEEIFHWLDSHFQHPTPSPSDQK